MYLTAKQEGGGEPPHLLHPLHLMWRQVPHKSAQDLKDCMLEPRGKWKRNGSQLKRINILEMSDKMDSIYTDDSLVKGNKATVLVNSS